eukprot:6490271-Amphidinium_carterae.1
MIVRRDVRSLPCTEIRSMPLSPSNASRGAGAALGGRCLLVMPWAAVRIAQSCPLRIVWRVPSQPIPNTSNGRAKGCSNRPVPA